MILKKFDKTFLNESVQFVCGVDEAGRGPLAGPVVAAAVIFDSKTFIEKVNDSKKINEHLREELYDEIINKSVSYGIGIVKEKKIDKINILQAAMSAMQIAVKKLSIKPDLILIDGNKSFATPIPTITIVKGDSKSFSIAAASILAKVTRDRIMRKASEKHPNYKWFKNKGYGTREHIAAIKEFGITSLHRRTFLSKILNLNSSQ